MELIDKAVPANASPFSAVISIFYEPTATFNRLASRRAGWVPALLLALSMFTLTYWYFGHFVDFAWLQADMLASVTDPAMREKQAQADVPKAVMTYGSAFGAGVGMLVSFAIVSLYLLIVGKVRNIEFGFRKGFALAAWSSLPIVLMLPVGALQMALASSNQIPYESLFPLSLNQLLFHYERAHPMAALLEGLSVLFAWNLVLLVIGYQAWAGVKRATAAKTILIPYAVVYGIWFAYALSKTA
jgi:hypothetical protein